MSEAKTEVNRKLDGVMEYLHCVNYPKSGRGKYKKFFWDCRDYFRMEYYHQSLPDLSPELNGKLAYFQYGKSFDSVPFLSPKGCESEEQRKEAIRFQALASDKLTMKAFVQEERIIVEALYLVCAGLIGFAGRACRKGSSLGHMQVLDERHPPDKASAMTFSMCMVLQAEDMWDILRTNQFPFMMKRVRITHSWLRMRHLLRRLVMKHKTQRPLEWTQEGMALYKDFLLRVAAEGVTKSTSPNKVDDSVSRELNREVSVECRAVADDTSSLRTMKSMNRALLEKVDLLLCTILTMHCTPSLCTPLLYP
jgi:hypothetical protein